MIGRAVMLVETTMNLNRSGADPPSGGSVVDDRFLLAISLMRPVGAMAWGSAGSAW